VEVSPTIQALVWLLQEAKWKSWLYLISSLGWRGRNDSTLAIFARDLDRGRASRATASAIGRGLVLWESRLWIMPRGERSWRYRRPRSVTILRPQSGSGRSGWPAVVARELPASTAIRKSSPIAKDLLRKRHRHASWHPSLRKGQSSCEIPLFYGKRID